MKLSMMLQVDETFTTMWLSRSSEVRIKVRRWPQSHFGTIFSFYRAMHYSAKRGLAIAFCLSVRLSVTLVDQDHIGWKSWKLTAQTISPIFAHRSPKVIHLLPGNMEKFLGENVRSTPTSITSGWIESTESHVISGGVAVCLVLSAHRAVIFAFYSTDLW